MTPGSRTEGQADTAAAAIPERQAGLRRAFRANAAFSGASGLAITATSRILPGLLGAGTSMLYLAVGVFLLAFALRLVLLASGKRIPRKEALMIVVGDSVWVGSSIVVIWMGVLNTLGAILVGVTAVVVGGLAAWQGRRLPPRTGWAGPESRKRTVEGDL